MWHLVLALAQAGDPASTGAMILRRPEAQELSELYPPAAMFLNVEGGAKVRCVVTPEGKLDRCEVLWESPLGARFGAATMEAASLFTLSPARERGVAVEGFYEFILTWKPPELSWEPVDRRRALRCAGRAAAAVDTDSSPANRIAYMAWALDAIGQESTAKDGFSPADLLEEAGRLWRDRPGGPAERAECDRVFVDRFGMAPSLLVLAEDSAPTDLFEKTPSEELRDCTGAAALRHAARTRRDVISRAVLVTLASGYVQRRLYEGVRPADINREMAEARQRAAAASATDFAASAARCDALSVSKVFPG